MTDDEYERWLNGRNDRAPFDSWDIGVRAELYVGEHLRSHDISIRGFDPGERGVPDGYVRKGVLDVPVEVKTARAGGYDVSAGVSKVADLSDIEGLILAIVVDFERPPVFVPWAKLEHAGAIGPPMKSNRETSEDYVWIRTGGLAEPCRLC